MIVANRLFNFFQVLIKLTPLLVSLETFLEKRRIMLKAPHNQAQALLMGLNPNFIGLILPQALHGARHTAH